MRGEYLLGTQVHWRIEQTRCMWQVRSAAALAATLAGGAARARPSPGARSCGRCCWGAWTRTCRPCARTARPPWRARRRTKTQHSHRRRVRAEGQEGRQGRAPRTCRGGARDRAARGLRDRAGPASCPAASGSGSRWPGRWSTGRRCCCSTSRSARSTSSSASEMQIELKAIQREVGITFVFVTHDQEEALTMSDRIAVFNAGRIEQVGHAGRGLRAAGHPPSSPGFVGTSNLIDGAAAQAARPGRRVRRPAREGQGRRPLGVEPGAEIAARRHAWPRSSTPDRSPGWSSISTPAAGVAVPRRWHRSRPCSTRPAAVRGLAARTSSPPHVSSSWLEQRPSQIVTHLETGTTMRMRPLCRMSLRAVAAPALAGRACAARRRVLAARRRGSGAAGGHAARRSPHEDASAPVRARSTSSPGRATPRTAPTTRRRLGAPVREGRPAARSTSRSPTPPTRWST